MVSIILGITVDNIGINSLFTTFALPLSLLTIIVAVSARREMVHPDDTGSKEATWGLALGVTALVFISMFIIGVAVLFTLVFRH